MLDVLRIRWSFVVALGIASLLILWAVKSGSGFAAIGTLEWCLLSFSLVWRSPAESKKLPPGMESGSGLFGFVSLFIVLFVLLVWTFDREEMVDRIPLFAAAPIFIVLIGLGMSKGRR